MITQIMQVLYEYFLALGMDTGKLRSVHTELFLVWKIKRK